MSRAECGVWGLVTMTPLLLVLVTALTCYTESAVVNSTSQDSWVTHSNSLDVAEPTTTTPTTVTEGDAILDIKVNIADAV